MSKRIVDIDDQTYDMIRLHCILSCDQREALMNAIEISKPYDDNGDLISREALKKQINATDFDFGDYYDNTEEIRKRVCEVIDNAQAIPLPNEQIAWEQGYEAGLAQGKQDRPQGRWIDRMSDKGYVECPFCHKQITGGDLNFCVKCGADMRGGAE